jgi:hypothetical protein
MRLPRIPFQSDEQDYRPLLPGQFGEGALHIAKLQTRKLMRRERQTPAISLRWWQLTSNIVCLTIYF